MKRHCKKHSGFTLVEVIISIALFAILMTPIYSVIISVMNNNKYGQEKQTGSLYGQEIFEEVKNGDIVPVKDKDGGDIDISSKKSDLDISGNKGTKQFGNGYEAAVTISKNTSINLNKNSNNTGIEPHEFKISLTGDNESNLKVNDEPLNDVSSDVLNLVISTSDNKIVINDGDNNEVLTVPMNIKADNEKDKPIMLTIDFSEYKLKNNINDENYKNVKISVYNQCDFPLNICLLKSTDFDVSVESKIGDVKVYDNRAADGSTSNPGQLYDINVEVTYKQGNEIKTVFTSKATQNINAG